MAVNDNDRVTSRRLKQFWDLAKPWIQTLVSGAIDTSEAAMESSMDTKILAAKPDYTKPNIDGQIGKGFGYNDMVGNYTTFTNNTTYSNLITKIGTVDTLSPFKANPAIGKQMAYLRDLYNGNTNEDYTALINEFLKGFEGKLVAFPKAMFNDNNFTSIADFISNPENMKSTYVETEQCLISPVWTVGDNTYQTKLFKNPTQSNAPYFVYSLSINGGNFSTNYYPSDEDGMAWCASYNNLPLNFGVCDIPDNSISSDKLSDDAVITAKIKNGAVTENKIASCAVTQYKLSQNITDRLYLGSVNAMSGTKTIGGVKNFCQLYGNVAASTMILSGFRFISKIDELFSGTMNPVQVYNNDYFVLTKTHLLGVSSAISSIIIHMSGSVGNNNEFRIKPFGVITLYDGTDLLKFDAYFEAATTEEAYQGLRIIPYDKSFFNHLNDNARMDIYFPPQCVGYGPLT